MYRSNLTTNYFHSTDSIRTGNKSNYRYSRTNSTTDEHSEHHPVAKKENPIYISKNILNKEI
jgi:hypothetical protein